LYLAGFKRKAMRIFGIALITLIAIQFTSCKKDDGTDVITVPPRMLSEVALENDAEIREYLQSHFYNYEEFANPPADFNYKIVLDTIAGSNADKTPLLDQVESVTLSVSSDVFGLDDDEDVDHTLYYLSARDGLGGSPTPADSTFLRYEGSLLDGTLFDGTTTYKWQYLPFFLRGYAHAVSKFNVGDGIIDNGDGTTSITNSGIGLMFLPSGLAYFNGFVGGIPQYSVLIFKVDTGLYVPETDYDNDGIPSILEDLDGDGDVSNDNTDASREIEIGSPAFPNHIDTDDDQDGTQTRDEISDSEGNIIIPYPDTDGDGTPDYLDRDTS